MEKGDLKFEAFNNFEGLRRAVNSVLLRRLRGAASG